MKIVDRLLTGLRAFRESYVTSQLEEPADWCDFQSRRVRYDLLWASYNNSTYRTVHKNAAAYKRIYGLYRSIRSLRNPSFCIAENLKSHIWGGPLSTGVPIATDDQRLSDAIAQIFEWSQWQTQKDLCVLYGAVLGDVGLKVVDDLDKVRLEVISPGIIRDIDVDNYGNVKSYILQWLIDHPEKENVTATYTEECTKDGDLVVFNTYLDQSLYAFPTNVGRDGEPVASWSEPYGFTPFVMIKNIDLGNDFGFAETHVAQSRIRELDDLTSMLSDQIRKMVNTPWLFTGMKKPGTDLSFTETAATANVPEPWREEDRVLYTTNENAKAQALTANLNIEDTLNHIDHIYRSLEADYPELRLNQVTPDTNISGRALRLARQPLEGRLMERRAVYDASLVAALQMCISIGGMRGIFPGFSLDSYAKGDEDFTIAERPIFVADPEDNALEQKALWETAKIAVNLGIPVENYLRAQGYSEEELAVLLEGIEDAN